MNTIIYSKLTNENFNENSLDDFIRHQEVKECWRKINGELTLVPCEFTENWSIEKRRKIAAEISAALNQNGFGYGAFDNGKLVGYVFLSTEFFGSEKQYIELKMFHISEPFRQMGIGKQLFLLACAESKKLDAKKLYISAHSSKESQAAYRKLGCVEAAEINPIIAENEPFDIQMEYDLRKDMR